jgi:hypothetical protein
LVHAPLDILSEPTEDIASPAGLLDLLIRCERELAGLAVLRREDGKEVT